VLDHQLRRVQLGAPRYPRIVRPGPRSARRARGSEVRSRRHVQLRCTTEYDAVHPQSDDRQPRERLPAPVWPSAEGRHHPGLHFSRQLRCATQSGSRRRNPPRNAFSFSPRRQPGGSSSSSLTPPPPRTTSSGSIAADSCSTVVKTAFVHFFLPNFFSPRSPT